MMYILAKYFITEVASSADRTPFPSPISSRDSDLAIMRGQAAVFLWKADLWMKQNDPHQQFREIYIYIYLNRLFDSHLLLFCLLLSRDDKD